MDDWNREMDLDRQNLEKEQKDTAENLAALEALRKAGLARIAADAKAAGDAELAKLDEQLERIQREHQTHAQQIEGQYDADVAKFSAAEEKKTLKLFAGRGAAGRNFADVRDDSQGADG